MHTEHSVHGELVDSDGAILTVRRSWLGPDEPTVLFINAVGMRAGLLDGLAGGFAAAGFNFLTWELRGSPGPSRDVQDCTLDVHVSDAMAILAAYGVRRPHLAGWCTGASVALHAVRQLGDQAASLVLVDGAFLFNGVPGGPLGNAMYAMCGEIVADSPDGTPGSVGAYYHELARPRGNEAAVLGLSDQALIDELTLPYRGGVGELISYAHGIRSSCAYDPVQLCRDISCPTLVMARRDDKMVAWRNSDTAARHISNARLVISDSGGHYGLFVDPDAVPTMAAFAKAAQQV